LGGVAALGGRFAVAGVGDGEDVAHFEVFRTDLSQGASDGVVDGASGVKDGLSGLGVEGDIDLHDCFAVFTHLDAFGASGFVELGNGGGSQFVDGSDDFSSDGG